MAFSLERDLIPPHAYRSYRIASPGRRVSCARYECDAFLSGWLTVVPADSPQAEYIRTQSGRAFREERDDGGLARFTFEPGQEAFGHDHRLPVEGAERFLERPGDRRLAAEWRQHTRADDWVDSFANNQISFTEVLERG